MLAGLILFEHDNLGARAALGTRVGNTGKVGLERLADAGEGPADRSPCRRSSPREAAQAIEDLVQEGGVLFDPDPRRVHVDADDRPA